MSQERFANLLGVSFTTVNRWEAGRAVPEEHAPLLEFLEKALDRHSVKTILRVLTRATGNRRALITALVWLADEGPPSGFGPPSSQAA